MQEIAQRTSGRTSTDKIMTSEQERKLLDLINDLERFRQEKWFSRDLNIFEAVGLVRQEIRHSNFLAYLLNPQQNHGLQDGFLKRLIQKAIDKLEGDPPIGALKLALADFSDALVAREWRNIDLLIESKNNSFVLAIENKIGSVEGKKQLETYEKIVSSEYPNQAKLFCLLTAEGESASRQTWSGIGYSEVIEALQEARHRSSNLTAQQTIVIDNYIDLVRRNIVPDQSLIEQCRRIYSLHKEAIDLIIEHGQVNSFVEASNTFFDKHPDLEKFQIRPTRAAFLPKQVLEQVPPIEGTNWWGQARPLVYWFNLDEMRLGFKIEVGPFLSNKFDREAFVKRLQNHLNSKAKIYPKFTRVYSRYADVNEDQIANPEEICSKMETLYADANKHSLAMADIAREFFGGT
jgi:hypothetical protein